VSLYHANYEFDDGFWLAELAEEPRVHSFGRSLHTAKRNLIDAVTFWFKVDPQNIVLRDVLPEQLADAQELVDADTSTREDAELRGLSASLMTRATVRRLATETQLSQRDIASLLDLSHQRVQQILKPETTFHAQVLDAKNRHEAEELACAATRTAFQAAGARKPDWEHVIHYPERPAVVAA